MDWLRRLWNRWRGEPAPSPPPPSRKGKGKIPPALRLAVWETYFGKEMVGSCYCCGVTIYRKGWHCAHVVAEAKGGEIVLDNLRPCCRYCNLSMGNQNLYTFIRDKELAGPGAKNHRGYLKRHPSQREDKRTNNWGRRRD